MFLFSFSSIVDVWICIQNCILNRVYHLHAHFTILFRSLMEISWIRTSFGTFFVKTSRCGGVIFRWVKEKKPLSLERDKGFASTLRYHSSWRGKTRPLIRSPSTPCTLTGTPGPTYLQFQRTAQRWFRSSQYLLSRTKRQLSESGKELLLVLINAFVWYCFFNIHAHFYFVNRKFSFVFPADTQRQADPYAWQKTWHFGKSSL